MRSPRSGAICPTGAHPGNTGGKKGRSGRPPQAFKNFLASLQRNPKAQHALEQAACDPDHRSFAAAWNVLTKFGPLDEGQQPMMTPEQAIEAVGRAFAEGLKRKKAAEKVAQGTPAKS